MNFSFSNKYFSPEVDCRSMNTSCTQAAMLFSWIILTFLIKSRFNWNGLYTMLNKCSFLSKIGKCQSNIFKRSWIANWTILGRKKNSWKMQVGSVILTTLASECWLVYKNGGVPHTLQDIERGLSYLPHTNRFKAGIITYKQQLSIYTNRFNLFRSKFYFAWQVARSEYNFLKNI